MTVCQKFAHYGCDLFVATIEDLDKILAKKSGKPETEAASLLSEQEVVDLLPEELKDFADVFSLKQVDCLPLHCPYNYEIHLLPEKDLPFGPLYSMSRNELSTLCE